MLSDIINNISNESEIQAYLENNLDILKKTFVGPYLYLPKFKLGSEYECDFVLFDPFESMHCETLIIELKLPYSNLLTKAEVPTKDLNLAMSQVNKYANWIRDNNTYFIKSIYSSYSKFFHNKNPFELRNYIRSCIIIGQREQYNEKENQYRRNIYEITNCNIIIKPYDILISAETELTQ